MKTFITPDRAEQLLKANTRNRRLNEPRIKQFASDILAGRWVYNGESIKISKSGVMIDGQHRCYAIVKAGQGIETELIDGLDEEAQDTVDIGGRRTAANALQIGGHTNATQTAAILKVLLAYKAGALDPQRFDGATQAAIVEATDKHDVTKAVGLYHMANTKLKGWKFPKAAFATAYHIAHQYDVIGADEFFVDSVVKGLGLENGSPALALRDYMQRLNTSNANGEAATMLWFALRSFKAHLEGREIKLLRKPAAGWMQDNVTRL